MENYSIKNSINYSSSEPIKKNNQIKKEKSLVNSASKTSLKKVNNTTDSVNTSTITLKDESTTIVENRIGSGLTRNPSKTLKEITSRTAELPVKLIQDSNGVGEFLMLDVASSKRSTVLSSKDLESTKNLKIERENSKLSNNCRSNNYFS